MPSRLLSIATLFLKLGTIGFGGPATNLALMEEEVVRRRKWLSRDQFLDFLGATNLIPGPNSTEMACHIGYAHGGLLGLVVAGAAFVVPAALITVTCAWSYVQFGQQPQIGPLLAGIKPAVLAIVFGAGWRLGRTAIKGWLCGAVTVAVAIAPLCGASEIGSLLVGGVVGMLALQWLAARTAGRGPEEKTRLSAWLLLGAGLWRTRGVSAPAVAAPLLAAAPALVAGTSLLSLGWFFLKVGAVLYGSGYVLIAYLQGDLVERYHWLTHEQLLDAVAVGQFTPGPILSTATFIGYLIMSRTGGWAGGLAGAAVATVAIFLPSFILVAITNPFVPNLRKSRWTGAFLDAINAASIGLMAAVTIKLASSLLFPHGQVNWSSLIITAVAIAVVLRWQVHAVWLVVGGALLGLLLGWLGG